MTIEVLRSDGYNVHTTCTAYTDYWRTFVGTAHFLALTGFTHSCPDQFDLYQTSNQIDRIICDTSNNVR